MNKDLCNGCKYYIEASDGIINHEICLKTKDKETTGCIYRAIEDLGKAFAKLLSGAQND